jgi:hypothetical protein
MRLKLKTYLLCSEAYPEMALSTYNRVDCESTFLPCSQSVRGDCIGSGCACIQQADAAVIYM